MEELNKTQIVLLTLFVTFVTSVTTGIVTVTLLQQAPAGVTQTINRVVEHTIEKVTPVTTKTETRLVGQEDEIINTAAMAKPAIVRIVLNDGAISDATSTDQVAAGALAIETSNELGTGFVISTDGLIATSYSIIPDQNQTYTAYVGDKKYQADVVFYNHSDGLALLKIQHDKGIKFFTPQFMARPVALGQTVVVLGRDLERYTVSVGLVASLKEATLTSPTVFKTTVRSDATNIGGPLLSGDGLVVGLNLEGGNAIPVEILRSRMASTTSR